MISRKNNSCSLFTLDFFDGGIFGKNISLPKLGSALLFTVAFCVCVLHLVCLSVIVGWCSDMNVACLVIMAWFHLYPARLLPSSDVKWTVPLRSWFDFDKISKVWDNHQIMFGLLDQEKDQIKSRPEANYFTSAEKLSFPVL